MKRVVIGLGLCLILFAVINLAAGLLSPDEWAFNAAKAELDRRGPKGALFSGFESKISGGFLGFGRTATVTFKLKEDGDTKRVHVTLRKPVNLLGWQVAEYHEE